MSFFIASCKKEKPKPIQSVPTGTPYQILDAQTHTPIAGVTVTFYGGWFGGTHVFSSNADGYIIIDDFYYESVKFEKTGYLTDRRYTIVPYMDMQRPVYLNIHVRDVAFYMGDHVSLNCRPFFQGIYNLPEDFWTGTDMYIIREGDLRAGYVTAHYMGDFNIPFSGSPGDTIPIDCFY